jgi:hypothetical protein
MIILVSKTLSAEARGKLEAYGDVVLMESKGIVYDAISSHPDIFCCPVGDKVVVAPNIPEDIEESLTKSGINLVVGEKYLGKTYPGTAAYNAVVSENYFIGNLNFIDEKIKGLLGDRVQIHVKQAYTRCNLLPLTDDRFITSDKGIMKAVRAKGPDISYVDPDGILLNGFKNGFFGGCCGLYEDKLFIHGSLDLFPEGGKVKAFLKGFEIIELDSGPLRDVGSIMFLGG